MSKKWFVYILRCVDGVYYTGMTNDIERRFREHESGKGCKFTRGRLPVRLVYTEECPSRSEAHKRELKIKPLTRQKKEQLIEKW